MKAMKPIARRIPSQLLTSQLGGKMLRSWRRCPGGSNLTYKFIVQAIFGTIKTCLIFQASWDEVEQHHQPGVHRSALWEVDSGTHWGTRPSEHGPSQHYHGSPPVGLWCWCWGGSLLSLLLDPPIHCLVSQVEAGHFFTYLWALEGTSQGDQLRKTLQISWEESGPWKMLETTLLKFSEVIIIMIHHESWWIMMLMIIVLMLFIAKVAKVSRFWGEPLTKSQGQLLTWSQAMSQILGNLMGSTSEFREYARFLHHTKIPFMIYIIYII